MEKKDFYITKQEIKNKSQDIIAGSWNKLAKTTLLYFILELLLIAVVAVCAVFVEWYIVVPVSIIVWLFMTNINYGYNAFMLEFTKTPSVGVKTLFSGFGKKMFRVFVTETFKIISTIVCLALVIVPGVVCALNFSMTNFVHADDKVSGTKAMGDSARLMNSNKKRLASLMFDYLGWFLLGIITVGIAFIWVLPKYKVAKAVFYEDLKTDF